MQARVVCVISAYAFINCVQALMDVRETYHGINVPSPEMPAHRQLQKQQWAAKE